MSITMFQVLAGLFFVASIAAGIWLIIHLTSLAAAYKGYADIVPAEARPRHSSAGVVAATVILLGGAAACILLAFAVVGIPAP